MGEERGSRHGAESQGHWYLRRSCFGWRASETWFYAYLMGWPRIAVYDGGWFECPLGTEVREALI